MELKLLYDFSSSPRNLYWGQSIATISIRPAEYGIETQSEVLLTDSEGNFRFDRDAEFLDGLNSRVLWSSVSDTNKKSSVSGNYLIFRETGRTYVFLYSAVETSNSVWQIDLYKIWTEVAEGPSINHQIEDTLNCRNCGKNHKVRSILEQTRSSSPGESLLFFICDRCKKQTIFHVDIGRMKRINFQSESNWEVEETVELPTLHTRSDPEILHCWFEGVHFEYPTRD